MPIGSLPFIKRHRMPFLLKLFFFRPLTSHFLNIEDLPCHRKASLQWMASQAAIVNPPLPFNSNTNTVFTPDISVIASQQLKAVYSVRDKATVANLFVLHFRSSMNAWEVEWRVGDLWHRTVSSVNRIIDYNEFFSHVSYIHDENEAIAGVFHCRFLI